MESSGVILLNELQENFRLIIIFYLVVWRESVVSFFVQKSEKSTTKQEMAPQGLVVESSKFKKPRFIGRVKCYTMCVIAKKYLKPVSDTILRRRGCKKIHGHQNKHK